MAKKQLLTPEQKRVKLANVLASYYGMKAGNKGTAKAHLMRFMKRHELTADDVTLVTPKARQIIVNRTTQFFNHEPIAQLKGA